jgi:hypothetical protein
MRCPRGRPNGITAGLLKYASLVVGLSVGLTEITEVIQHEVAGPVTAMNQRCCLARHGTQARLRAGGQACRASRAAAVSAAGFATPS